jgi:uncharacterized membrane protein
VDDRDRPEDVEHSIERTITLTDAVVAIAMTLLVLPLVELAPEVESEGLGTVLTRNDDVFLGFVLSFLVIYVFWTAHDRAFAGVRRPAAGLRALNMWWLLIVAFLPFPTAVVGRHATTSTVPFYIGTMFALSVLTSAMVQIGRRAREAEGRAGVGDDQRRWRAALTWASTAVFGLCALIGTINTDLGLLGLLLLIVVRIAQDRTTRSGGKT